MRAEGRNAHDSWEWWSLQARIGVGCDYLTLASTISTIARTGLCLTQLQPQRLKRHVCGTIDA